MKKAVAVTWYDAVSHDDWEDEKELQEMEPHRICSLGFLISESENSIKIAASWDEEREAFGSTWIIPKSWIISVDEIDVPL